MERFEKLLPLKDLCFFFFKYGNNCIDLCSFCNITFVQEQRVFGTMPMMLFSIHPFFKST